MNTYRYQLKRTSGEVVAGTLRAENQALKHFLRESLYSHERVLRETDRGRRVIGELFRAPYFLAALGEIAPVVQRLGDTEGLSLTSGINPATCGTAGTNCTAVGGRCFSRAIWE